MATHPVRVVKDKATVFVNTFDPYRSKYIVKERTPLFPDGWVTKTGYLNPTIIAEAIVQRIAAGYFTTYLPKILGVDIDDHEPKGEAYLLQVYGRVCRALNSRPSLLVRTDRGLHAYWIFDRRIPADILYLTAWKLLSRMPVEIRPTPTEALRIPAENRFLDPETMVPLFGDFESIVEAVTPYHSSVLFAEAGTPREILEDHKVRRRRFRALRNQRAIEKAEAEELPLYDGESNDAFCHLCFAYRQAGLDQHEAFDRFLLCLERSPNYTGDLRNQKVLWTRIKSWYHNTRTPAPKQTPQQVDLFEQLRVQDLVARAPFGNQRRKPIERFLMHLLGWKHWQDEILENPRHVAYWDFLYPFYEKNRRAGFYPLPKSVLRRGNKRYYELLPWLFSEGFMIPGEVSKRGEERKEDLRGSINVAPLLKSNHGSYSTELGICKYYMIDPEGAK